MEPPAHDLVQVDHARHGPVEPSMAQAWALHERVSRRYGQT
jgi:hypothetical protein